MRNLVQSALVEHRIVHAERSEDLARHELVKRLLRGDFHDQAQHRVARVGILEFLARREIAVPSCPSSRCSTSRSSSCSVVPGGIRSSYAGSPDVCVSKCLTVILLAVRGKAGKELRQRVVERKLAAIDEQHDGRRGELLRNAGHAKIRLRRARRFALDVGQSVGVLEHDLAFVDRHHASADMRRQAWLRPFELDRAVRSPSRIVAANEVSNDNESQECLTHSEMDKHVRMSVTNSRTSAANAAVS